MQCRRLCGIGFIVLVMLAGMIGGARPRPVQGRERALAVGEGCDSADIVLVTSDGAATRAVETLAEVLAMHHWAHCPESNYRVGAVDAITGKEILSLTPVTLVGLASWQKSKGLVLGNEGGKKRPAYRYEWKQSWGKALSMLKKDGDPGRRQILLYAGDLAIDAPLDRASEFIRDDMAALLKQYPKPEIWVLSGEEDADLQKVAKVWEEVIGPRGGVFPKEDNAYYSQATEYLGALFQIIQKSDQQFEVQQVGCGTYRVPSASVFAVAWLRRKTDFPTVTLKWAQFSTADAHDNVWVPVDKRGVIVTDPPSGKVVISSAACGDLIGFAQIGAPGVKVSVAPRLPQDRGQAFEGGVLKVSLTGWQEEGTASIGEPFPSWTLSVTGPDGKVARLQLRPSPKENVFVSDALPRYAPGSYRWQLKASLPYNGLDGGNGTWEEPSQTGTYEVFPVKVVHLEVSIDDQRGEEVKAVSLHGSIQEHLVVKPVVVRVQVKDEDGVLRSPEDLFGHPERALTAVLTNVQTGEQEKKTLALKGSFWYGEVGAHLGREGKYRLEIYKQPLSSEVLVWDASDPWRGEFRREDTFFHKPAVWAGIGGLILLALLLAVAWSFYVRTQPLEGALEFYVPLAEGEQSQEVVVERIDLAQFGRRIIQWNGAVLGALRISRKGQDAIKVRRKGEGEALRVELEKGEEKPFVGGMKVRFVEDEKPGEHSFAGEKADDETVD